MNIGAALESAIYLISSSMLYPAMILLIGGFAVVVAGAGSCVAEWGERSKARKRRAAQKISDGTYDRALLGDYAAALDEIAGDPAAAWSDVEKLWRTIRRERWEKLDYLRILARLGPAMGLVGTLIPMGTGLAALSQGDTTSLSSDLVVAFSTTVVGLCYGVAAYVLYTLRARWTEEDLELIQAVVERRASRLADGEEKG